MEGGAGGGVCVLRVADVGVIVLVGAVGGVGCVESGVAESVDGGAWVLRFADFEEGCATDWVSICGYDGVLIDNLSACRLTRREYLRIGGRSERRCCRSGLGFVEVCLHVKSVARKAFAVDPECLRFPDRDRVVPRMTQ